MSPVFEGVRDASFPFAQFPLRLLLLVGMLLILRSRSFTRVKRKSPAWNQAGLRLLGQSSLIRSTYLRRRRVIPTASAPSMMSSIPLGSGTNAAAWLPMTAGSSAES